MELSPAEWKKAETIARELAVDTDRNELGKIVAYARVTHEPEKIMRLVQSLPRSGYVRSGRTRRYLSNIATVLQRELADVDHPHTQRLILGWAFRLLTTYQLEKGTRRAGGRAGRGRR